MKIYLLQLLRLPMMQPLWVSWVSGHSEKFRLGVSDMTRKMLTGNIRPTHWH